MSSPVPVEGSPQSESPKKVHNNHSRDKCLFCRIIDENEKEMTRLIYKDNDYAVFPDIRPAAKYHFLVVPVEHIRDSKSLTGQQAHIDLLNRLVEIGNKVLTDKIAADKSNVGENKTGSGSAEENAAVETVNPPKVLMGFHWPPFHTVNHLHLHVIAPSDSIGFIARQIFRPNSYWFISPDWLKTRLEKLKLEGK